MIKITITPPKKESYSVEFTTVSDAIDYLLTLHTYGYEGACEAAQQKMHTDAAIPCDNCGTVGSHDCSEPDNHPVIPAAPVI